MISAVVLLCNPPFLFFDPITSSPNVEDAIVTVFLRSLKGMRGGCGSVIGDGSLIVTARHVVFEGSEKGKHQAATLVDIASLYLGDVADAEIIADDDTLDLAILKTSWKGHPAPRMTDTSELLTCNTMTVVGTPDILWSIDNKSDAPFPESVSHQSESLIVDFVAMRQKTPRFISLLNPIKLKDGWGGSPILLADSSAVAGCFVPLNTNLRLHGVISARGPAISQVMELLDAHQEVAATTVSKIQLPRPEDGNELFLNIVQACSLILKDQFNEVSVVSEKLTQLRPDHTLGYSLAGSCLSRSDKNDEAESSFQKALAIKPDGVVLRCVYAQFLQDQGQTDRAQKMYEQLWQSGHSRPTIAVNLSNIYSEKNDFTQSIKILEESLKENLSDAYLNFFLGNFLARSGNADEGINYLKRTVQLLPEKGPMRGVLAHTLEKDGQLDEAKRHFLHLLEIEPKSPVVHFWLAKFLAEHRPGAKEKALKEAQITLSLLPGGRVFEEEVKEFISALENKITDTQHLNLDNP